MDGSAEDKSIKIQNSISLILFIYGIKNVSVSLKFLSAFCGAQL